MEKEVHHQFMSFLEEEKLISPFQFGFRKGKSTELAAISLIDDIRQQVDSGHLVGACFLDLSKAFDTISHNKLISKLESYGVNDLELDWFKNYLFNRRIQVSYDNALSEEKSSFTGVPQGSILGPLLFVVFFNDIVLNLKHSKIIKYADDTVIYFGHQDFIVIEKNLSDDLDNLSSWFNENELMLNMKRGKTELLLFGTPQRLAKTPRDLNVNYNQQRIHVTKSYKYLGIEVNSSLNLNSHFDKTYKKMSSRLRLLSKLRPFLTSQAAKIVFNHMIIPMFTYCSLLKLSYNSSQLNQFKSLERRAKHVISGTERDSSKFDLNLLNISKRRICMFVHDVITGAVGELFTDYFELRKTRVNTRNNGNMVVLPKVKLEYGRRSVRYLGAKIFNELPLELRRKCLDKDFKKFLKVYLC